GEASTEMILAWAYGERTKWTKPIPCRFTSSKKPPSPWTRRRSSFRGTLVPMKPGLVSCSSTTSALVGAPVSVMYPPPPLPPRSPRRCSHSRCNGRCFPGSLCGSRLRWAQGFRRATPWRSSTSPACSSHIAARGTRRTPAAMGSTGRPRRARSRGSPRLPDGAPRQDGRELPPVLRRRVDVRGRVELGACDGRAHCFAVGRRHLDEHRRGRDAAEYDTHVSVDARGGVG